MWDSCKKEFAKPKYLAHASDLIYKFRFDIAKQMKFPLVNVKTGKPLKVVEHIGCHYSKMFPSKGFGGAEYPHVLVGMIEGWDLFQPIVFTAGQHELAQWCIAVKSN